MSAVLDTHTVLGYLENVPEPCALARTTIEDAIRNGGRAHVSAISGIEAVHLVERNKIPAAALPRRRHALTDPSAGLSIAPVATSVTEAVEKIPCSIVSDMPDGIIAATAFL